MAVGYIRTLTLQYLPYGLFLQLDILEVVKEFLVDVVELL